MKQLTAIGTTVYVAVATAGGVFTYLFGAWNKSIQTLLILMAIDWLTGLLLAAIHKSPKTQDGGLSSKAGFDGIVKKAGMLVVVMVANLFGALFPDAGGAVLREGTVIVLIVNEGLSIVENLKAMGVPIPNVLMNFIYALKKKKNEPLNPSDESLSDAEAANDEKEEEIEPLDLGKDEGSN